MRTQRERTASGVLPVRSIHGASAWIPLAAVLAMAACADETVLTPERYTVQATPEAARLAVGDIVLIETAVRDADGRPVADRPVTVTTDDPAIARIDASGRLRAVAPGTTMLRGVAAGDSSATAIEVTAGPAVFALGGYDRAEIPVLVVADSVEWNGGREYHEVYVVGGTMTLRSGETPRYELEIRVEEYDVRVVDGRRTLSKRLGWRDYDRGLLEHDPRGDLVLTSEYISPLGHRAAPVPRGFAVDYRIPGTDERVELFYRR